MAKLNPDPSRGTEEMASRDVLRVIWRHRRILLLGLALGGVLGVVLIARSVPIFTADAALRIQPQRQQLSGFESFRPEVEANLAETVIEELQTRSLAGEVVEALGLNVRVAAPEGVCRRRILAQARADSSAAPGTHRLRRTADRRFVTTGATGGTRVGAAAPGEPLRLPGGGTVVLAASALEHAEIVLEITRRDQAIGEVREGLSVTRPDPDAEVVHIRYESPDPCVARAVPNTLAARFIEREQAVRTAESNRALQILNRQLSSLGASPGAGPDSLGGPPSRSVLRRVAAELEQRILEAQAAEALRDPQARLIDPAVLPRTPIRPRKGLILLLSLVIGLVLGTLLAFVRALFDRRLYTPDQIRQVAPRPLLGLVPEIERGSGTGLRRRRARALPGAPHGTEAEPSPAVLRHPSGRVAEAYRLVRTKLLNMPGRDGKPIQLLVTVSGHARGGEDASVANLALVAARQSRRVLLIDADMRRGVLARLLPVGASPGLSDLLRGAQLPEALLQEIPLETGGTLHFIASGAPAPDAAELLSSQRARVVFTDLRKEFDLVILHTPPLAEFSDGAVLGPVADAVLLVVRAGHSTADEVRAAVDQLTGTGTHLLGTLANDGRSGAI
jgi:capsular exopolysaccharide synthesis family protein